MFQTLLESRESGDTQTADISYKSVKNTMNVLYQKTFSNQKINAVILYIYIAY